MELSRAIGKFATAFVLMLSYWALASVIRLLLPKKTGAWLAGQCLARFIRVLFRVLGIRVNLIGQEHMPRNALLVANHMSYIDTLAIQLLCPSVFTTSKQMLATPLLGQLCEITGCVAVNRASIWELPTEVAEIAEYLRDGRNAVVFPEGTTTDYGVLLPFRSSLLEAAFRAQKKLVPVAVNYPVANNRPINLTTRDAICWYGGTGFARHLFAMCRLQSYEVSIEFLPALDPTDFADRKELTAAAFDCIHEKVALLPDQARALAGIDSFYHSRIVPPARHWRKAYGWTDGGTGSGHRSINVNSSRRQMMPQGAELSTPNGI